MIQKHWIRPLVGLVVTVGFLLLIAERVDWASVRGVWLAAAPAPILLALCCLAAGFSVRLIRWWWMLRMLEPSLPLPACVRPFLLSYAVNNVAPLRAGDTLRAFGFSRELRSPPMRVLGTMVVERLLDSFVLLCFFFVALAGLPQGVLPPALRGAASVFGWVCVAALLVLLVAPRRLQALLPGDSPAADEDARPWRRRFVSLARHLLDGLSLLQSPWRAGQLLLLSAVAWILEGAVFAGVAHALGLGAVGLGPWFALATGTLSTLIPSSPGYVGTFDYFTMQGIIAFGAQPAAAAAFALLVHLLIWLPITAAGAFVFLLARPVLPAPGIQGSGELI